jgi:CHAT domain-containing protein
VQGLTSSFLQAGARVVVATGWRIRDKDVVSLVDDFYGGLARGGSVMDALRTAKLRALETGAPARTWAAFVAVGDARVTVPVRPAPRAW